MSHDFNNFPLPLTQLLPPAANTLDAVDRPE
jgi:hypothetical protein